MPDHNTAGAEGTPIEAPPIAVTPGYSQSIIIALALAAVTVYGAVSNMLIYFSTRDIAGFIIYLKSSDFLQVISAVTLLGGVGGMVYRTIRRKGRELFLEQHVTNDVAYLKGVTQPAPPPTNATKVVAVQDAQGRRIEYSPGIPIADLRPEL